MRVWSVRHVSIPVATVMLLVRRGLARQYPKMRGDGGEIAIPRLEELEEGLHHDAGARETRRAVQIDPQHPYAVRMLGTPDDADDALQEAWIRAQRADRTEVTNLPG